MATRAVVTGWVGTGTAQDPYRPDINAESYGVVKLRGHPARDSDALCVAIIDVSNIPSRSPRSTTNRLIDLGEGGDRTRLSAGQTAVISAATGIVTPSRVTIGELLMLAIGDRIVPSPDGIIRIETNGHVLHEQPVIAGGAAAVLYNDDFGAYSDGALETVSGGNWAAHPGWETLQLSGTTLQIDPSNTVHAGNYYATAMGTDHHSEIYAEIVNTGTGYMQVGPVVRLDTSALTGYTGFLQHYGTATGQGWQAEISEVTATVYTSLAKSITAENGTLRLEAAGSSIRFALNEVVILSATDTDHTTENHVGVHAFMTSPVDQSMWMDQWIGGTGWKSNQIRPWLVASGAIQAEASTTALGPVVIPAGAVTNDIMVLQVMLNAAGTFSTPAGWTQFGTLINSANQSTNWFWKRHTGTESNPSTTTSVTMSTTIGGYGRIHVIRGCVTTGTPYEGLAMAGTPTLNATVTYPNIVTSGPWRLAMSFVSVDDDNSWTTYNQTGFHHAGGRVFSTTGGDCMMDVLVMPRESAGTLTGGTFGVMNASDYWRTLSLAWIPAPVVPEAPRNFRADVYDGSLEVFWDGSWFDATVTGFDFDWATAAAPTTWLGPVDTGSSGWSYAITPLTNGVAYVFRVRAKNATGAGPWSFTSESFTPMSAGIDGTAAWTEDEDTVALTGVMTYAGTASWIDEDDTIAAAGLAIAPISGTMAWVEVDDVVVSAGAMTYVGVAVWTEVDDTITAAGAMTYAGVVAWTETDDVVAIAGVMTYTGITAWTEDADVVLAAGDSVDPGTPGTVSWTETDDVIDAAGAHIVPVTGTAAWVETDDTYAAVGVMTYVGVAVWTETDDAVVAVGAQEVPSGPAAWIEADDLVVIVGSTEVPLAATLAWTEDNDIVIANGTLSITGTISWVEDDDDIMIVAVHVPFATSASGSIILNPIPLLQLNLPSVPAPELFTPHLQTVRTLVQDAYNRLAQETHDLAGEWALDHETITNIAIEVNSSAMAEFGFSWDGPVDVLRTFPAYPLPGPGFHFLEIAVTMVQLDQLEFDVLLSGAIVDHFTAIPSLVNVYPTDFTNINSNQRLTLRLTDFGDGIAEDVGIVIRTYVAL